MLQSNVAVLNLPQYTPGVNYLETLVKPNVELVNSGIEKITESGCLADNGKEYPIDVLICATGFDTSFRPRFPLIGRNGIPLADEWNSAFSSFSCMML